MQLRFFNIPVHDDGSATEELNGFLAGHRILAVDRHLVQDGANSAWAVCVGFEPAGVGRPQPGKRGKVDYREVLNEQDFAVFARLRSLRKELADSEGVPAYAAGLVDAPSLQAGYGAALAITAHADSAAWRREQLRRRPLDSALHGL